MDKKYIETADWALAEALRQGAQAARVELTCIDNLTVQCQGTEVSTLQQSNGCGLTLRLFVDGRYGSYSANRMDHAELQALIRTGITCTRLLTPDPDRSLPDPARYYRAQSLEQNVQEVLALGGFSEEGRNLDAARLALQVAEPVMQADPRLISFATYLSHRSGWQYMADSQSFRGLSGSSASVAYATATLHDQGDSRPSDSWMASGISLCELQPQLVDLGGKALLAAQQRLGACPIPSGRYHVAVEPVSLMRLLLPLLEAMQDFSLYQHRSVLQDYHLGDEIVSPRLTLTEEPQRHGAFSACLFDYEGVRTSAMPLIQEGRLCQWFIGTYYGRKLQMSPVLSGPNVLCIAPGTQSRQEIFDSLDDTILITGFLGGNCNEVTGDFSFGIEGQLYRHGERIQGIAGMNLTGNILDFWRHLYKVANDVERIPDGYFPTLFFEDIEIRS